MVREGRLPQVSDHIKGFVDKQSPAVSGVRTVEPKDWRAMGLTDEEYDLVCTKIGKHPNFLEVAMFSVMWSEHCSYKNSRKVLKLLPTKGDCVLQGPGENAGIVDVGDGLGCGVQDRKPQPPERG